MEGGKIKMIRPDFREFQGQGVNELLHYGMPRRSDRYSWGSGDRSYQGESLSHSAKGSTWEDHKYVKKIGGVYYYPVGYEDGRTIDELTSKNKEDKEEDSKSTKEKVDQIKHHFDEYLKEKDIDWRTLPKEEVDAVQRTIVRLLESGESGSVEELINKLKPEEPKKKTSSSKSEKSEEKSEKKDEDEKTKSGAYAEARQRQNHRNRGY